MNIHAAGEIASVTALVAEKLDAVERLFREQLGSDVEVVDEATRHVRDGGGKRIRPVLLLLSAGACGYRGDLDVLYATVLEYVHTATLIHDDVLDEALTRRGRATLNARYGNSLTVLVGDWVYTKAMDLALTAEDPFVLKVLTDVVLRMVEGQILEARIAGRTDTTEEQALEVNRRKTAHLFAGCTRIAAHIARADSTRTGALREYGLALGMAFQLVDDVLDFTADERTLGKPVLNDLREGRMTYPLLAALEGADPPLRERIGRVLTGGDLGGADREAILRLAHETGAIARTLDLAREHAEGARTALRPLHAGPYREALERLPDLVLERRR